MGKTGTTDNAVHVWLVGSSTAVSTAVWVGNIKGKQSLRQISVNGTQAALLRHAIFRPTAQAIDAYYPGGAFPAPDPALLKGNPVIVPDLRGMTLEAAKAAVELAELNFVDGGADRLRSARRSGGRVGSRRRRVRSAGHRHRGLHEQRARRRRYPM